MHQGFRRNASLLDQAQLEIVGKNMRKTVAQLERNVYDDPLAWILRAVTARVAVVHLCDKVHKLSFFVLRS